MIIRSGGRSVGLIVDSAREFAAIPEGAIQAPPDGLSEMTSRYLRGMAHIGERLVLVLDVVELLQMTDVTSPLTIEILPSNV